VIFVVQKTTIAMILTYLLIANCCSARTPRYQSFSCFNLWDYFMFEWMECFECVGVWVCI